MKQYNHYPILVISDIDNKILKLKLTYHPSEQDKLEDIHNVLVRESHIAEALDFLLEHFYLIQKHTENKITFEVGALEILNEYRTSIKVRDIGENIIKEDFDVKININLNVIENDISDFFYILKEFINEQEEETIEKMIRELDMMTKRKRQNDLINSLKVKDDYSKGGGRSKI
jgi:hypothetical protein